MEQRVISRIKEAVHILVKYDIASTKEAKLEDFDIPSTTLTTVSKNED